MKPLDPPLLAEPPDPLPEAAHQALRDATVALWRDLWVKVEAADAWQARAEAAEARVRELTRETPPASRRGISSFQEAIALPHFGQTDAPRAICDRHDGHAFRVAVRSLDPISPMPRRITKRSSNT